MNAVTRQTIVCRQCGTWGDDSMPAKAADLCGYCSDDDNTALVWADADTLIVARMSTGNLVRTITWNLGTDRVSEELTSSAGTHHTERSTDLPTIIDYALASGWTLDVLTSNDENAKVLVELRETADTTVTVGSGPGQVNVVNRMTKNAAAYEVTNVLLDR